MLSRRTVLQFLASAPAALALRPLAAAAVAPETAPSGLVIVNGWVLRRDDLASLPRATAFTS